MNRLNHKVAVITGAARGIGLATAKKFLAEGASVAIWDIDRESGKAAIQQLREFGGKARFYPVDTANLNEVTNAAGQVNEELGRIDILVNNAGIIRDASLKKMSAEQWQQVINVNLTGVFHCTKAVYPYMAEQGWGRILNAASVVAHYGNFGQTNYVAAKAGVIGMTRVWAREFGRKGITVNAVAPGFIQTEMTGSLPELLIQELITKTPVGRMGEAEDIANAYLFLASEEASFINGAVLNVDGGLVL